MEDTANKQADPKRINIRKICCAGFLTLFIAGLLISPFYLSEDARKSNAKAQPLSSLVDRYMSGDIKVAHDSGLSMDYDRQQTSDDITIYIKDVYVDKASISISTASNAPQSRNFHYEIYYNDQEISNGAMSSRSSTQVYGYAFESYDFMIRQVLPEKCEIKLVVKGNYTWSEPIMEFVIPVDYSAINKPTRDISLMKEFKYGDKKLMLKNIVFTPINTVITLESSPSSGLIYTNIIFSDENLNPIQANRSVTARGDIFEHKIINNYTSMDLSNLPKVFYIKVNDPAGNTLIDQKVEIRE